MLDLARKDVQIPEKAPKQLLLAKHIDFITGYATNKESYVNFE
jgi:hypothetical protein